MVLWTGDWMAQAACHVDGEPWNGRFLEAIGVEMGRARQQECRQICNGCPVLEDCHRWVFSTKPDPVAHMFAAGMTYRQRRRWRRLGQPEKQPPRCGSITRYRVVGCRCDRCLATGVRIDGKPEQGEGERSRTRRR